MKVFIILTVISMKLKVGSKSRKQCTESKLKFVDCLFSLPPLTSGASAAPPAQSLTTIADGQTTAGR